MQREETWSTVPMTKNSRTIDPNKIPKISKVRQPPAVSFLLEDTTVAVRKQFFGISFNLIMGL